MVAYYYYLNNRYYQSVTIVIFSLFLGWTAADPAVICPLVCPLDTAMYRCNDSTGTTTALQWSLRNAADNGFLSTLIPTSQHPNIQDIAKGVLFTAKRDESFLRLSFTAELKTESIRVVCVNADSQIPVHCDVSISGEYVVEWGGPDIIVCYID